MFFERMRLQRGSLSDPVYLDVVTGFYATTMPAVFVGLSLAIVGGVTAIETDDLPTAILTVAGVLVAVVRVLDIFMFRRRAGGRPLSRSEAAVWERRYVGGSVLNAFVLGLVAARSIVLGDAICSVMAIGIGFGFGAGVVVRLSLRPVAAFLDLFVLAVPVIAMIFVQPDLRHVGLGLLLTIYLAASFAMVRLTFKTAIGQIKLKEEFERLARSDPMTGVFNRAVLAADLPRLLADPATGMVAVHAIDLDRFKEANDRFGHPAGDALLKQVAGRLQSLTSRDDLLVRMGGDEFILVQRAVASFDDAEAMAQSIVRSISAPYDVDGQSIELGVSVGIAVSPDDGRTTEALLSRSDKALYRAKESRGRYVLARDLRTQLVEPAEPSPTAGLAA